MREKMAKSMADQQPGKPWDEAASIGENFTDMCLDEDDRSAGEDK
jgi:hypothetical protein